MPTPDTSNGKVMYTSNDSVIVFREPSDTAEKIATLTKVDTEVIAYTAVNNGWVYVQYEEGKYGYIFQAYLFKEKNGEIMYVTGNSVNVRKGPSKSTEVVATVKKGESYLAFENVDGWILIQYESGKKGYVLADFLSKNAFRVAKLGKTLYNHKYYIING